MLAIPMQSQTQFRPFSVPLAVSVFPWTSGRELEILLLCLVLKHNHLSRYKYKVMGHIWILCTFKPMLLMTQERAWKWKFYSTGCKIWIRDVVELLKIVNESLGCWNQSIGLGKNKGWWSHPFCASQAIPAVLGLLLDTRFEKNMWKN